jgi:hypothetical protein
MSKGFSRGYGEFLSFDSVEVLEDRKTGDTFLRFFREGEGDATKERVVKLPKLAAKGMAQLILAPINA